MHDHGRGLGGGGGYGAGYGGCGGHGRSIALARATYLCCIRFQTDFLPVISRDWLFLRILPSLDDEFQVGFLSNAAMAHGGGGHRHAQGGGGGHGHASSGGITTLHGA